MKAYRNYTRKREKLTFWRSKTGHEVDFLIGDKIAIEVKGSDMVSGKHLKGLKALAEDLDLTRKIVVSMDPVHRKIGEIDIYPYSIFLKELWDDKIVSTA